MRIRQTTRRDFNFRGMTVIIIVAIAAFIWYAFFNPELENALNVPQDGRLAVHFIDIGQGDSELIVAPDGKCMLIDTGPLVSSNDLKSYLINQRITELEYVVLTHPHEDHIGGCLTVLGMCEVKNIIMPDATADTFTFERLLEAIDAEKINVIIAKAGDTYSLGDARFKLLAPNSGSYKSLNDYSIVLRLTYSGTSFLFTGDAEEISEDEILEEYKTSEIKSNVLKVGHHGSSSSTGKTFLKTVAPDIAVISCGDGNDYKHPHSKTLKKLTGITLFRTDLDGSIVLLSDGASVSVYRQQKSAQSATSPE